MYAAICLVMQISCKIYILGLFFANGHSQLLCWIHFQNLFAPLSAWTSSLTLEVISFQLLIHLNSGPNPYHRLTACMMYGEKVALDRGSQWFEEC